MKRGEKGLPCLTPLLQEKYREFFPLIEIESLVQKQKMHKTSKRN